MSRRADHGPSLGDYLKAWPQYLLPSHTLSRVMHALTRSGSPLMRRWFMRWFVHHFRVDMSIAQESTLDAYANFNAFFTRALRPDARPIADDRDAVISPVDGTVSQAGVIDHGCLLQAKGREYSLLQLLGGDQQRAAQFAGGAFATFYLSPRDYHRIHMPLNGRLRAMSHIPGRLFSVNAATTRVIPGLFARNERVVAYFDTDAGPMALVLVGAIFVGSIETVWAGEISPPAGHHLRHWHYEGDESLRLAKGEEMGRFNMGSTVIVLFGRDAVRWSPTLQPATAVQVGQQIGDLHHDGSTEGNDQA